MNEPGMIRRTADGTFEYLRRTSVSLQQGRIEHWEPAATHAALHMQMPQKFLHALREAGYEGGPALHDLLVAEGWRPPERAYLEVTGDGSGRALPPIEQNEGLPVIGPGTDPE